MNNRSQDINTFGEAIFAVVAYVILVLLAYHFAGTIHFGRNYYDEYRQHPQENKGTKLTSPW